MPGLVDVADEKPVASSPKGEEPRREKSRIPIKQKSPSQKRRKEVRGKKGEKVS